MVVGAEELRHCGHHVPIVDHAEVVLHPPPHLARKDAVTYIRRSKSERASSEKQREIEKKRGRERESGHALSIQKAKTEYRPAHNIDRHIILVSKPASV